MSEEESLIEAPVADTTTEQEVVTPTEDGGWKLADEISGEGDRPEWFKDKYNSVSDQAQAYSELEKKFGGFTGAPKEDYELTVPEGVEGEFDMKDPRIGWFKEAAKNSNMSQDTFTQMLHGWVEQEVGVSGGAREAEIQALGSNAQSRLKDLGDWGAANLSSEQFESMKSLASSASGVEVLEALISKTQKNGVANVAAVQTGVTKEALHERISDPKYQTSADFRKETERLFDDFYGG
jgi:hypothetical protein